MILRRPRAGTAVAPATAEPPAWLREQPSIAVITMARDEGPLLAHWVRHYADIVGRDNLLVLDDHSTDGSTEALDVSVLAIADFPDSVPFEPARMALLSGIGAGLLALHDYVLFVDVDEFLHVDPAFGTLIDVLEQAGRPEALGVVGLNVVQLPGEAPLDPDRPLLDQRRAAVFVPRMCKPALKRVPAAWRVGSHGLEVPFEPHPALLMLHLKFADRDRLAAIGAARHAVAERAPRSSWAMSSDDLVAVLEETVAGVDPARLPELDVTALGLDTLIKERNGAFQPPRVPQADAMRAGTVVAIPERLKERHA